jgi:hypothetical protein
MPSYSELTNQWLQQSLHLTNDKSFCAEIYSPLSPYEDFARKLMICSLELLMTDKVYLTYLSNRERKDAQELKTACANTSLPLAAINAIVERILLSSRRGWWIFDIGFTNGLLYESLITLSRYLKFEQQNYLLKHTEHLERTKTSITQKADNRCAELLQNTIKLKNNLIGVGDPDKPVPLSPEALSPQQVPRPQKVSEVPLVQEKHVVPAPLSASPPSIFHAIPASAFFDGSQSRHSCIRQ